MPEGQGTLRCTLRCKFCSKTFNHAPALVQHERAHVQQMHSASPQSRIHTSAEGLEPQAAAKGVEPANSKAGKGGEAASSKAGKGGLEVKGVGAAVSPDTPEALSPSAARQSKRNSAALSAAAAPAAEASDGGAGEKGDASTDKDGSEGGEKRQKRERKQTAFYDPQQLELEKTTKEMEALKGSAGTGSLADPADKGPTAESTGASKAGKKRKPPETPVAGPPLGAKKGAPGVQSKEDFGDDEQSPCASCLASNKGFAHCFGQGHIFVNKQDGSRPQSCNMCKQRNKGPLHCFKRGHMPNLRPATKEDVAALETGGGVVLSPPPEASFKNKSTSLGEEALEATSRTKTASSSAAAGGRTRARDLASEREGAGAAGNLTQALHESGRTDLGSPGRGARTESGGRGERGFRGSADRNLVAAFEEKSFVDGRARPSVREARVPKEERARDPTEPEPKTRVIEPISVWVEVVNQMRVRLSQRRMQLDGGLDDLASVMSKTEERGASGQVLSKQLLCAAAHGHTEAAQQIVEQGADVNACDVQQHTPLHHAVAAGNFFLVRLLLEAGADVAARGSAGDDVCHVAASQGHEKVLDLLIEKGASIDSFNDSGLTARHVINLTAENILAVTQEPVDALGESMQ